MALLLFKKIYLCIFFSSSFLLSLSRSMLLFLSSHFCVISFYLCHLEPLIYFVADVNTEISTVDVFIAWKGNHIYWCIKCVVISLTSRILDVKGIWRERNVNLYSSVWAFVGMRNRSVGRHNMNDYSSRSHTILTVHITSEQQVSSCDGPAIDTRQPCPWHQTHSVFRKWNRPTQNALLLSEFVFIISQY